MRVLVDAMQCLATKPSAAFSRSAAAPAAKWGVRRVSNLAFPRMNMGAIPAFEGWGDPSRILGAMGSTGIEIRAQMRLKNGKNP